MEAIGWMGLWAAPEVPAAVQNRLRDSAIKVIINSEIRHGVASSDFFEEDETYRVDGRAAVEPIRGTTQFMLDVFRLEGRLYIRPVKVQYRSREVMNTLHVRSGEQFRPVKESAVLAELARWKTMSGRAFWTTFFRASRSCRSARWY